MDSFLYNYYHNLNALAYYSYIQDMYSSYSHIIPQLNFDSIILSESSSNSIQKTTKIGFTPCKNPCIDQIKIEDNLSEYVVKNQDTVEITRSETQSFQSIKMVQNKTKDLMRPFARMIYKVYQRLLYKKAFNQQADIKQVTEFNSKVNELRSKNPCKFTDLMMTHLKTISTSIKIQLQTYISGVGFSVQIHKSDAFKHWKNKNQLIDFFRQFITENKNYLKPTKFYKFSYKKSN